MKPKRAASQVNNQPGECQYLTPSWLPNHMDHNEEPTVRLRSLLHSLAHLDVDRHRVVVILRASKIAHLCRQIDPQFKGCEVDRSLPPDVMLAQLLKFSRVKKFHRPALWIIAGFADAIQERLSVGR